MNDTSAKSAVDGELTFAVGTLVMTGVFASGYAVGAFVLHDFLAVTLTAFCGFVTALLGLVTLFFAVRSWGRVRGRRTALLASMGLLSVAYFPAGLHFVRPLVERHLRDTARKTDPIAGAITAFTTDVGHPPSSFDALVPKYLAARPAVGDGCLIYEIAGRTVDAVGCALPTQSVGVLVFSPQAPWGLRVRFKRQLAIFYCPPTWCTGHRGQYGFWSEGEDYSEFP